MHHRTLGTSLSVSAVGLGCMGMSFAYGGQEEAEAIRTLRRAVDLGVTFFDTAEMYGPFDNEVLVGKALAPVREHVVIATKFGFRIGEHGTGRERITGLDSSPANVKAVAEASLKRLGVEVIDLFYQHRVDPAVPIEETVGAMAELVHAGKVRTLGLSEAGVRTIRRAHAVHPITAIQSEYSLWTRDPEEGVLDVCRELGIGFVPYSPLGRGLLTGTIRDAESLGESDFRRTLPRFQGENFSANLSLVDVLAAIAGRKGVTTAQLALAWVLSRGDFIVPIPGARKIAHLEQNAAAADIVLTPEDLAAIEAAGTAAGARFSAAGMATIDR